MRRWLHFVVPGIVLVLGVGLRFADPPQLADARLRIFDIFQEIKPRPYTPSPVRVVDLDDASLERYGQWPWPRTLVAQLVERLGNAGAAAIAFDIVFSEPDRTSPGRIADLWPPGRRGAGPRCGARTPHNPTDPAPRPRRSPTTTTCSPRPSPGPGS